MAGWRDAPDGTYCAMGYADIEANLHYIDPEKGAVPVPPGTFPPTRMAYQLPFPSDDWMERSNFSIEQAIPVWLEALERDRAVTLDAFSLSRRSGNDWVTVGRWTRAAGWTAAGQE